MRFWVLSGSEEHWVRALEENKWGVGPNLKKRWDKLSPGDVLAFYVKAPVSGIIGFGIVERIAEENIPYWQEEVESSQVIWPFRWYFRIEHLCEKPWKENKVFIKDLRIEIRAGLNSLTNKEAISSLLTRANVAWKIDVSRLMAPEIVKIAKVEEKPVRVHDKIRDMIRDIGEVDNWIAEIEYPIEDLGDLDVVWRRVPTGNPTYVFEVQIGGDIFQALIKLKHAFDEWNSIPFLVIDKKLREKARGIIGGAFHQIKDKIRIVTTEEIEELHNIQSKDKQIKDRLSLPFANIP